MLTEMCNNDNMIMTITRQEYLHVHFDINTVLNTLYIRTVEINRGSHFTFLLNSNDGKVCHMYIKLCSILQSTYVRTLQHFMALT